MTIQNPQAFSREAFIFCFKGGENYDMCYLFSVTQNFKDTFIDNNRKMEQQTDIRILKSTEKAKLW